MKYFIYCRKSQEAEDRQVMSLEGQRQEIEKIRIKYPDIEIAGIFEEAKSAKSPGRKQFLSMLKRIEKGEAQGILAWHPDRLARNSMDGGQIIFLLDQGHLRDLKFCSYSFENTPQGKFMLGIMFSNSKYYSDSLSVNVQRGMRQKLQKGWKPGLAPIGYRNCRETGTIIPDPHHFKTIKAMFDLLLSGNHTPASIYRVLKDEWGYTTPIRKSRGGTPLTLPSVYKVLSNPFYAGDIRWKDQLHKGKHKPAISKNEFFKAQEILGNDTLTPRNTNHAKSVFPYSRIFRCGACGLSVTSEKKTKPSGRSYIYYHCTRINRAPRCREPSIEERQLEQQISEFIDSITLPKSCYDWLVKILEHSKSQLKTQGGQQKQIYRTKIQDIDKQLQNLTDLKIRDLIPDADFLDKRQKLQIERNALEENRQKTTNRKFTFEPVIILTFFLFQAKNCYMKALPEEKRELLKILCSNPALKTRKALLVAKKPFEDIHQIDQFRQRCTFSRHFSKGSGVAISGNRRA